MKGFRYAPAVQDSRREWKMRAAAAVKVVDEMKTKYDKLQNIIISIDKLARRLYRPLVSRKKLLAILEAKELD